MTIYLILMFITGFICVYFIKKEIKTSDLIIYSLPLGILIHTIIFLFLSIIDIYYTKQIILLVFAFIIILFVILQKKKKLKIINDIKNPPLFFILFILYIGIKLICFASTSFVNIYNDDEYRAWLSMPKSISINNDFKKSNEIGYSSNSSLLVANASMIYEFENINMQSPRVVTSIFSIILIIGMYITMVKNNVNKTIAGLLTILFFTSSVTFLQLLNIYSTNPIFMCFFILSSFNIIKDYTNGNKINLVDIFMVVGANLTRSDGIYLTLGLIILLLIINKKLLFKKNLSFPVIIIVIGVIDRIINKILLNTIIDKELIPFKQILERLSTKNLMANMLQSFKGLFILEGNCTLFISLIAVIIIFFLAEFDDSYKKIFKVIIILEILYFVSVFIVQLSMFNMVEYLSSASFTRYNMMLMPLNYILIGIFLSNKYKIKNNS